MLTDNEVKKISQDALGFKALAKALEEIICSSETPITIGVYGEWGSGKTSLMRMTEDLLKDRDMIKTVWFDVWKFHKTHDLRVALINTVLRKIKEDESTPQKPKEKVGKLLKRVNWLGLGEATLSLFLPLPLQQSKNPLLKNPEEIPGKTLELIGDFEDEFRNLTKEYVGDKGRLVVFVDDLDRCIPGKAVDVLEAIKSFLNVPQSSFIIGADKKIVEDGILQKYGQESEDWGRNYLDKIIQVPVNLLPLRKDIIIKQFIEGLKVPEEIKQYAHIIAEAGNNPRMIKRLLNRFEFQRILADKRELDVDSGLLAKLAVIEFRWYDLYTGLVNVYGESKTNLVQVLDEASRSEKTERGKRLEEWKTLKKFSEDKDLMRFLLEEEPLIANVDLGDYVYMIRSTTELRERAEDYFNIAFSFGEKENHTKAVEYYEKALELNPRDEEAWYNKGFELSELGRHEEAIVCYEKALELNPRDEEAWYNKGVAFNELGRHEEALICYTEILRLKPKDQDAWKTKSYLLEILGRKDEARKCLEKAKELVGD
jgi:tetratricopeptide (TPR) repeat protein